MKVAALTIFVVYLYFWHQSPYFQYVFTVALHGYLLFSLKGAIQHRHYPLLVFASKEVLVAHVYMVSKVFTVLLQ